MDLNLSPEEKLLLALSNLSFNEKQKSELTKLASDNINWSSFTKLANNHGISALIYNNLKELNLIKNLPGQQQTFLRGAYLKSLSRNTILLEKFLELQAILNNADIDVVLIKGLALELTAWGNMGLRQMNDVDLYIVPDKALEAWKLLKNNGYTSAPLKSPLHKKFLMYIGKHLPELHKDGISFEIHHNLFHNPAPRLPTVAQRAKEGTPSAHRSSKSEGGYPEPRTPNPVPRTIDYRKLNLNEAHLNIPNLETHFLYLISHLDYHEKKGEAQIRQIMDLCQLMTQCTRDIESSGICDKAQEYQLVDLILKKFYQLHIFWNMPLPDSIAQQLSPEAKQKAVNEFMGFLREPKGHTDIGHEQTYFKTVKLIPGMGNKILYTIGNLFPSLSFMQQRYKTRSRFSAFFYYPIRLLSPLRRSR